MRKPITTIQTIRIIDKFSNNIKELKELLKIPQDFEKQAKESKRNLDKFLLPIILDKVKEDLKKPPKGINKAIIQKRYDELIEEYKKIVPNGVTVDNKLKLKIDKEYFKAISYKELEKDRKTLKHFKLNKKHIEYAVLYNLVSSLECSFSNMTQYVLKQYPKIQDLSQKQLTYDELQRFSNIDEAKEYLISIEIDKLLFGSLSNYFDFFENKVLKFKLPNFQKYKSEIIEIKERRNLFIHNEGIANNRYFATVDRKLIDKFKIKKDKKIILETTYLQKSIEEFELIGLETLIVTALKFHKADEKDKLAWKLIDIIYKTFSDKNKNLYLGEELSKLLIDNNLLVNFPDKQSDYWKLNYWYILKKLNKKNEFEGKTKTYDISSKNHVIKLCYLSLIEKYSQAYTHIVPSLLEDDFDIELYEAFPILEELRKQPKAKEIIAEYKRQKK